MVWKYFLPLHNFPLHFVNCFLCCAEAFYFDVVSFVYLCFWLPLVSVLCLWNLYPVQHTQPFSFSSRSFIVSRFTFKPLIQFALIFFIWYEIRIQFYSPPCKFPICQHNLLMRLSCLHCIVFALLLKINMLAYVWDYFWALHFVPLV